MAEILRRVPDLRPERVHAGVVAVDWEGREAPPDLIHARQWIPNARPVTAGSVSAWVEAVWTVLLEVVPPHQPWRLHVVPHYGTVVTPRMGQRAWHTTKLRGAGTSPAEGMPVLNPAAGRNRCDLIRAGLEERLRERRRHLLKWLRSGEPEPWTLDDTLVQVCLSEPDAGWISVSAAPQPGEWRRALSPFPKGEVPVAVDKTAPSRAFAKLVEVERRWGYRIQAGETCMDLGAAPGSWTYVAASRGASVIAVDRAPLREDLLQDRRVTWRKGDAFSLVPEVPVDWLLCDVIAAPERTADLLRRWLEAGWMRRFVVTLKLRASGDEAVVDRVREDLTRQCDDGWLAMLSANRHEVCAWGERRDRGG